jgi:hypothetical protein
MSSCFIFEQMRVKTLKHLLAPDRGRFEGNNKGATNVIMLYF